MNVGIAANTTTFYHLPDKLSHKPSDPLFLKCMVNVR
jgi:hypothetical protein